MNGNNDNRLKKSSSICDSETLCTTRLDSKKIVKRWRFKPKRIMCT